VRWTPAENLHATLVFLGDVQEDDIAALTSALAPVAASAPSIPIEVTHTRPAPDRRPRMVWAALARSPALSELAAGMHVAAAPFAPGIRPPLREHGHITMARFRAPRPDLTLESLELDHPTFELGHVSLVHSTLGHGGAVYRTIAELPLAGGASPPA